MISFQRKPAGARATRSLVTLSTLAGGALAILLAQCAGSTPSGAVGNGDAAPGEEAAPQDLDAGVEAANDAATAAEEASCTLPPSGLTSDESCNDCLQASCCEAINRCFGNPACVVIDSCLTACFTGVAEDGGLAGCEERCHPDASGATEAAIEAELACLTGTCASACPGPPLCGTPGGSYGQTCSSCQLVGGTLTCDCVNQAGGTVVSTLDLCGCPQPPVVANTNGVLGCQVADGG
jgi:hypothetical protein